MAMTDVAVQTGSPEIPDKLYFKIGEVSEILGVEPYVLRYWETEFAQLTPKKSGSGHRLFRRKDVELLLRIKHLLYEKRYRLKGRARRCKPKDALPKHALRSDPNRNCSRTIRYPKSAENWAKSCNC